ncbi:unnamed protein product [Nyctereutes procyonoides]|uniref:(raccoon dog) hypothetical protein n=1 Tax=Nyctereutes procyonoides TaxID=34880 RepID=A0A811ZP86_NYCPR|nr:unnamed protein product [Nyctereutes procyonoides]
METTLLLLAQSEAVRAGRPRPRGRPLVPSSWPEDRARVRGQACVPSAPPVSQMSDAVTLRILPGKPHLVVTMRLPTQNCLLWLTCLISELEPARMACGNADPQDLKGTCPALGTSKPPASMTAFQGTLAGAAANHVGRPVLQEPLGPAPWERRPLIRWLDVAVQSFGWSDGAKLKPYPLKARTPKSTVSVAHLLATRQHLSKLLRTSHGSIGAKTGRASNKVPVKSHLPFQRCQHGTEAGWPPAASSRPRRGEGGHEPSPYGGQGGHEQGGWRGRREGGNKHEGGWTDGGNGAGGGYHDGAYQDSGFLGSPGGSPGGHHGGGHGGSYQGGSDGGFQTSTYTGSGYQGGGYQQGRYHDGGRRGDQGSAYGERGGCGGQGGGWGRKGYQHNHFRFGHGRHYPS